MGGVAITRAGSLARSEFLIGGGHSRLDPQEDQWSEIPGDRLPSATPIALRLESGFPVRHGPLGDTEEPTDGPATPPVATQASQHRESRGMEDSRGPRVASPSGTADSFNSSTRLEQNQELSR